VRIYNIVNLLLSFKLTGSEDYRQSAYTACGTEDETGIIKHCGEITSRVKVSVWFNVMATFSRFAGDELTLWLHRCLYRSFIFNKGAMAMWLGHIGKMTTLYYIWIYSHLTLSLSQTLTLTLLIDSQLTTGIIVQVMMWPVDLICQIQGRASCCASVNGGCLKTF